MYKNKAGDGGNNICGQRIKEIREKLPIQQLLQIAVEILVYHIR